jgi:hypothetical protein
VAVVVGSYHLSRGRGSSLSSVGTTTLECSVLECGQYVVSVGNVLCSGSSSQRHDSKRTAAHAPKQCLPSVRPKLSATNSNTNTEQTHIDINDVSRIRIHDPSVWVDEDDSCLRPRGHCDRELIYLWHASNTRWINGAGNICIFSYLYSKCYWTTELLWWSCNWIQNYTAAWIHLFPHVISRDRQTCKNIWASGSPFH